MASTNNNGINKHVIPSDRPSGLQHILNHEQNEEDHDEDDEDEAADSESDISHVDFHSLEPIATTLPEAIDSVSAAKAKQYLKEMAVALPEAAAFLEGKLQIPIRPDQPALGKRKRMETCAQCDVEYEVESNWHGICKFHPGDKTVNYEADIWDDHDENCHGTYEDCIEMSEYDEGAIWTCCEKPGDKPYCTKSRHGSTDELRLAHIRSSA